MSVANELVLASLRPMQKEDVEAVMEIERVSYDHPWKASIYEDCLKVGYGCWIMEYAQKVVGYGIMSAGAGEAHILNLCIREDYRRFGLGRMLLNHLEELSKGHNAETIFLEVRARNIGAYRLYEEEGFSEVGVRRNYYPAMKGREDAIIMAKELV